LAKVQLDLGRIDRALTEAFQEACLLAHRQMVEVISEPGAFDGFDGDIVDQGILRTNQQPPEFSPDGSQAIFRNTVDYAFWVYMGYTLRNGKTQKGRAWMAEGLRRVDLQKTFELLLKAKL
jgi:hypothetical protein